MQVEKSRQVLISHKVCPICQTEYIEQELNSCPADGTLLCPVGVDPLVGTEIGSYYVVNEIGRGGSSKVYKAENKQIGRTVALKVLDCRLASDLESVKRFEYSARAICKLTHPSISSVFDYGLLPDSRPYVVMEFVPGETLAQRLKRDRPNSEEAIKLLLQICDAMQTAHENGILHRDLKASNMMIDENGNIRLVDFGLAKIVHGDKDITSITMTGTLLGTPAYMSPEQCLGQETDARSDIYSLGCVMYELLTGKTPFQAESAFALMQKHIDETAPRPAQVADGSGVQLDTIVMKCLEKDPAMRFQSMGEVKETLNNSKLLTPGKPRQRSSRLPEALMWRIALATLALTVTIGGVTSYLISQRPQPTVQRSAPIVRLPYQKIPVELGPVDKNSKGKFAEITSKISVPGVWHGSVEGSFGEVNPFSPTTTSLAESPIHLIKAAYAPNNKKWYLLNYADIAEVDAKGNVAHLMPNRDRVAMFAGLAGAGFSAKRNRLSAYCGRDIQHYFPASGTWTKTPTKVVLDLACFSNDDDAFYGIGKGSLYKLDAAGNLIQETPLDRTLFPSYYRSQLYDKGDWLIAYGDANNENPRVYLINKSNGKVVYSVELVDKPLQANP